MPESSDDLVEVDTSTDGATATVGATPNGDAIAEALGDDVAGAIRPLEIEKLAREMAIVDVEVETHERTVTAAQAALEDARHRREKIREAFNRRLEDRREQIAGEIRAGLEAQRETLEANR